MTTKQSNWSQELSDFRDLLEPISPAAYNLGIELFNKFAPTAPVPCDSSHGSTPTPQPSPLPCDASQAITLHYGNHFFFFWD